MPFPTRTLLPGFLGTGCPSPPITLQQMVDAYIAADSGTQASFDNLLQAGVVTLSAEINAWNADPGSDQTVYKELLGVTDGGVGPPGPPGPPGPAGSSVTLPAMISALEGGVASDQERFKRDIVDVPTFLDTLGQLSVPAVWAEVQSILASCDWQFHVSINWHFESGVNAVRLNYTYPCTFELVGDIYLGGAGGGGGVADFVFVEEGIDTETCGVDGFRTLERIVINTPAPSGTSVGLGGLYSRILTKLDQLLRCCPPCNYKAPVQLEIGLSNWGSKVYSFDIDSIQFNVSVEGDPRYLEFGDKNIGRFARFAWIENSTRTRELEWINFDGEMKYAPNGYCNGFLYACSAGVTLNGTILYRDGSEEHFGLTL